MFEHLPNVGYLEPNDYIDKDPLATKWKPLRGSEHALLMKERLDELR